jgi:hypothetical protein
LESENLLPVQRKCVHSVQGYKNYELHPMAISGRSSAPTIHLRIILLPSCTWGLFDHLRPWMENDALPRFQVDVLLLHSKPFLSSAGNRPAVLLATTTWSPTMTESPPKRLPATHSGLLHVSLTRNTYIRTYRKLETTQGTMRIRP